MKPSLSPKAMHNRCQYIQTVLYGGNTFVQADR